MPILSRTVISPHRLQQRSDLLQAVRSFFRGRGYIEVDTPIRLPVLLPETHIKPFASEEWFLHTSPEQCMKRLLAQGCDRLFQICHCFRKEEKGRLHQSEFTLLEWYHVGWSYRELMTECEAFVRALAASVPGLPGLAGPDLLRHGERSVSLAGPWERLTVKEAFRRHAGMDPAEALRENTFDEVLVTTIEPHLGWARPVFLCDYPAELASLARRRADDPTVAERFELYIAGIELANGFSELIDPGEQRLRFAEELRRSRQAGNVYSAMPERFLTELANMGETAGVALGLDRLLMLLMGCATISEAVTLPHNYLEE
ncbi:MAG: EF-P lysine aminoacylase GenX [Desulfobulbus sp.]|nr:MAG: EF-P lysine aminoacylase GenX [Desulfobulbus sp.]